MSCISEFTVLETLEVIDVLGTQAHVGLTCKAEFLTRLLDSISADAPFRFFHLRLASYETLQPAVLCDEMFTDDVRLALQRVSALVRFDLTVECASAEQPVQDLSSALQLWFSKARLPVQICHSMVVLQLDATITGRPCAASPVQLSVEFWRRQGTRPARFAIVFSHWFHHLD